MLVELKGLPKAGFLFHTLNFSSACGEWLNYWKMSNNFHATGDMAWKYHRKNSQPEYQLAQESAGSTPLEMGSEAERIHYIFLKYIKAHFANYSCLVCSPSVLQQCLTLPQIQVGCLQHGLSLGTDSLGSTKAQAAWSAPHHHLQGWQFSCATMETDLSCLCRGFIFSKVN